MGGHAGENRSRFVGLEPPDDLRNRERASGRKTSERARVVGDKSDGPEEVLNQLISTSDQWHHHPSIASFVLPEPSSALA
jgi:hypothetical protein